MTDDMGDPAQPRTEFESLHAFQRIMWDKLHANRHKGSWSVHSTSYLLRRAKEEVMELEKALADFSVLALTLRDKNSPELRLAAEQVTKEAADVANFVMMIADNVGGLAYRRVDGG